MTSDPKTSNYSRDARNDLWPKNVTLLTRCLEWPLTKKHHVTYRMPRITQVAFQKINILFNRAHLIDCNFFVDRVLVRKKLFLINYPRFIKSDEYSWDNILRANLCPKVIFGLWQFYGQIWPFLTFMAILTHQTSVRIVRFRPIVAHGDEQDSYEIYPFALLKWPMPY